MRVKTLMRTRFSTLTPDLSLARARELMARERVTCLPVMHGSQVAGVLSVDAIRGAGPSVVPALARHEPPDALARLTVRDAMRVGVPTVRAETPVETAALLLADGDLEALPVVDGESPVGMLTRQDVLGFLADALDGDRGPGFDHVLVLVDFGEGTDAALAAGSRLARRAGRLTLLHVVTPRWRWLLAGAEPIGTLDWLVRQRRDRALALLRQLDRTGTPLDLGRIVAVGDPVEQALALAARLEADLLVVGRPVRRGLRRWRPGPAEALVARAPCPVLAVPPRSADHDAGR